MLSAKAFNPQPEPPIPSHARRFFQRNPARVFSVPPGIRPRAVFGAASGGYAAPPEDTDEQQIVELTTCPDGTYYDPEYGCVGWGVRGDDDNAGLPPGFVAPGAVDVRPANWNLEHKPHATYKIAGGDTFVGLAATYLGDGGRWREIWNTGRNKQIIPVADDIRTQGPIDMPQEAADRMRAWLKTKTPGTTPGEIPLEKVNEINASKWKYWAAGGVAIVALAGLVYVASDS